MPKKNALIFIACGAAGILVISSILVVFFLQPETGSGSALDPDVSLVVAEMTSSQATPYMPSAQETLSSFEPVKKPVDFLLQPSDQTNCGLTCRQLTATITNTGDSTAHDVCITLTVHNSRGDIIGLNGDPSIRQCVGDIASGETKSEPVTINADCGLFATKCLKETLTLETEITSEEKNVRFPNQLIAV